MQPVFFLSPFLLSSLRLIRSVDIWFGLPQRLDCSFTRCGRFHTLFLFPPAHFPIWGEDQVSVSFISKQGTALCSVQPVPMPISLWSFRRFVNLVLAIAISVPPYLHFIHPTCCASSFYLLHPFTPLVVLSFLVIPQTCVQQWDGR